MFLQDKIGNSKAAAVWTTRHRHQAWSITQRLVHMYIVRK